MTGQNIRVNSEQTPIQIQNGQQNLNAQLKLSSLSAGQTVSGKVISVSGNNVQISLGDNAVISAALKNNVTLTEGQSISFQVRSTDSGQITLSPLLENTSSQNSALAALNQAELPVTSSSMEMVQDMMQNNMSIDKSSLIHMNYLVSQNPGADVSDIVSLTKLNIPVTDSNLLQFNAYSNYEHEIQGAVSSLISDLPEAYQSMVAAGNETQALDIFGSISRLFCDPDIVSNELNGQIIGSDTEQLLQTPDNTSNSVTSSGMNAATDYVQLGMAGETVEVGNPITADALMQSGIVGTDTEMIATGETLDAGKTVMADSPNAASVAQPVEAMAEGEIADSVQTIVAGETTDSGESIKSGKALEAGKTVTDEPLIQPEIAGKDITGKAVAGIDITGKEVAGIDITGKETAEIDIAGKEVAGKEVAGKVVADNSSIAENIGMTNTPAEQEYSTDIKNLFKQIVNNTDNFQQILNLNGKNTQEIFKQLSNFENLSDTEKMQLISTMFDSTAHTSSETDKLWDKLFSSNQYNKIMKNCIENNWMLKPEETESKENVENLYKRLFSQTKDLTQILSTAAGTKAAQGSTTLMSNLEFMNQLNQTFTYIQLPLKMSDQNANGDLYVYTNRKNLSGKDGEVSCIMHLDMTHLGALDVYVRMKDMKVNTDFCLADESSMDLIAEHIDELSSNMKKRGYDIKAKIMQKDEKSPENPAIDEILENGNRVDLVSEYSFDARA